MSGQIKTYSGNNVTTAGDGGNLVPTEFVNRVIEIAQEVSIIFQLANVLPMIGSKRNMPTQTAGATVYWPGESTAITLCKPTFGIVNQIAKKMGVHCKVTKELLWDNAVDLESFFARIVAYALSQEIERVALVGNTGASPTADPFMGVRYASGAVSADTAATLTFAMITELLMGGSQAYANGAELVTSRKGLKILMLLKDGEDRPLWVPPVGPIPANVLGVPYRLSAQIPTTLTVGGESTGTTALFGNFKQYLLVSPHGGMEYLSSEHASDAEGNSAFTQALVLMRWLQDISIDVAVPAAFRYLDFK
jgi:HK97 family phage major capsid protein